MALSSNDFSIRRARLDDVERITEIYNHWIVHTHTSFDLEPHTIDDRRQWFRRYGPTGRYQAFVAASQDDDRAYGVTYSSPFKDKGGYDQTVETTVVLDRDVLGIGLGRLLLSRLVDALADADTHRAVAIIALPNEPSVALHEDLGYRSVGIITEAGKKFGRYWSVQIMERAFDG